MDLKLENESKDSEMDELSPPGSSSKRTRSIHSEIQAASCLVDGCETDLSNCRKYHQRHKVCEVHSKTPYVSINGQKLRFCQQCSRFHSLEEFDEGKRSCRKRLAGHNRRRRKLQPDTPSQTSSHFSGHPGLLHFTNPQTTTNCSGIVKTEEDIPCTTRYSNMPHKQNPSLKTSSSPNNVSAKQQFGLNNHTSPWKDCEECVAPARVDHSAPSLLSSLSCTNSSDVVHPLVTASPLGHGMIDGGLMEPNVNDHGDHQTLPFYWE